MMSLVLSLTTQLTGDYVKALDIANSTVDLNYVKRTDLASGTGAGQADLLWYDTRTLAASTPEDLDLAGVLTDAFGTTLTFAKIKGLVIVAAAANTNTINVTRPAANGVPIFLAAGDGVPVLPGGEFRWSAPGAGVAVTAGTGDLLTITNAAAGTSVTYDVFIVGTSA